VDEALVVRDDLRSYALRRCIRFYTAILVVAVTWTGSRLAAGDAGRDILVVGQALLVVLAGVELAAMAVMMPMAKARQRLGGGPETKLWAFAQGPWPSAIAAIVFVGFAAGLSVLDWATRFT
jgi:hypothetical protein